MYESLVELFEASCSRYKNDPLFGIKAGQQWRWLTYGDIAAQVDAFRHQLESRGVGPGDRVAIVSDNCVEWAVAAYAVFGRGAAFVPMYVAQSPQEWEYIIRDSGAKLVIAGTPEIYVKLRASAESLDSLEHVLGIGLANADPDRFGYAVDGQPPPLYRPARTELAGFIYTSGTTGNPKGVLLTHHNICSNVAEFEGLYHIGQGRSLSFLPWAHAYGQVSELHFFVGNGGSMAINDAIPNIVENLGTVRPDVLVAVPRIFNRIYDRVNRQMADRPALIRALFAKGIKLATRKRAGETLSLPDRILLALADRLIFSKVRARFGGRLRTLVSGSAALSRNVAEFIDALGIDLYEGYGLTEASPVVASNCPGAKRLGTVGRAIPGVRVTLDDSQSETAGEGELLVYGPNVMQGYHNLPAETAAVMTADGGLRTGDLARIDADGYITVTGRLKEQFKLENGKYVAPAHLEEQVKLSPFILNAMLYGANRRHTVLLVVVDPETVNAWAKEEGIAAADVMDSPRLLEKLRAEATSHCEFKNYETPRAVTLAREDFTTDNGLLTPSLKLKRNKVTALYEAQLAALYKS